LEALKRGEDLKDDERNTVRELPVFSAKVGFRIVELKQAAC
jgi:hypothetical protein